MELNSSEFKMLSRFQNQLPPEWLLFTSQVFMLSQLESKSVVTMDGLLVVLNFSTMTWSDSEKYQTSSLWLIFRKQSTQILLTELTIKSISIKFTSLIQQLPVQSKKCASQDFNYANQDKWQIWPWPLKIPRTMWLSSTWHTQLTEETTIATRVARHSKSIVAATIVSQCILTICGLKESEYTLKTTKERQSLVQLSFITDKLTFI